ncbi:MAG: hypothetical protein RJA42_1286 [Bacteroidota bacterium]
MRKAKPKKRYVLPDPKFKDVLVTKFVNNLMYEAYKRKRFRNLEKSIKQCDAICRG